MGVIAAAGVCCAPSKGVEAPAARGEAAEKQDAAPPAKSAEPAASSAELAAMFEREASGLHDEPVYDPQAGFMARVAAAAAPTVNQVGGASVVEIPIGTQAPVRCQLFPDDVDFGGTLQGVLKDRTTKVEPKQITPWAVRVVGEAPAAFVSVIYHAQSPRGPLVGELKVALHAVPTRPVLCMHDEPGYRKTFESVVSEFGESLKLKHAAPALSFVQVHTAHIGDRPVGFRKVTVSRAGVEREFSESAMMLDSASATELVFHDILTIETIDAHDRLIRGVWISATGGQVGTSVKLAQVKGKAGTYRYEGQVSGKAVSGELTTRDRKPLPSGLATLKRWSSEAQKRGPFSVSMQVYAPDFDATRLFDTKYFRAAGDPAQSFRGESGQVKISGKIDAQGFVEILDFVGPPNVSFRLGLHRGRP
jgi:hypothetical protein